jgi:hypothetical protein
MLIFRVLYGCKMTDFNGPIKTFSYTMSFAYNNTFSCMKRLWILLKRKIWLKDLLCTRPGGAYVAATLLYQSPAYIIGPKGRMHEAVVRLAQPLAILSGRGKGA